MKKTILSAVTLVIVGMMITSATSMPVELSSDTIQNLEEKYESVDIIDQEPEEDGLFGWVILRGFVLNPRDDGSTISARALNLHYLEITPTGVHKGVVRLKRVSFKNGIFIKISEKGLLGNMVRISGCCRGGIEIF
jgi:hypothetical protein